MPSDVQKLIFEMRNRPQDFALRGDSVLVHKPTRQEIWLHMKHYRLYRPYEISFTFMDRRRFHRAYLQWRRGARTEQRLWLRHWLCEPTSPATTQQPVFLEKDR